MGRIAVLSAPPRALASLLAMKELDAQKYNKNMISDMRIMHVLLLNVPVFKL